MKWAHVKWIMGNQKCNVPLSFFENHETIKLNINEVYAVFWSVIPEDTPQTILKKEKRIVHVEQVKKTFRRGTGPIPGYYSAVLLAVADSESELDTCLKEKRIRETTLPSKQADAGAVNQLKLKEKVLRNNARVKNLQALMTGGETTNSSDEDEPLATLKKAKVAKEEVPPNSHEDNLHLKRKVAEDQLPTKLQNISPKVKRSQRKRENCDNYSAAHSSSENRDFSGDEASVCGAEFKEVKEHCEDLEKKIESHLSAIKVLEIIRHEQQDKMKDMQTKTEIAVEEARLWKEKYLKVSDLNIELQTELVALKKKYKGHSSSSFSSSSSKSHHSTSHGNKSSSSSALHKSNSQASARKTISSAGDSDTNMSNKIPEIDIQEYQIPIDKQTVPLPVGASINPGWELTPLDDHIPADNQIAPLLVGATDNPTSPPSVGAIDASDNLGRGSSSFTKLTDAQQSLLFKIKPGEQNDSRFTKRVADALWTKEELQVRSPMGEKCPSKKDGTRWKPMTPEKMAYAEELLRKKITQEPRVSPLTDKELQGRLGKVTRYLSSKSTTARRTD